MIKSMTGYGRGESETAERKIICELRAVNHRYLDMSVKLPRKYAFAEDAIKAEIKKIASRGKIDVFVQVDELASSGAKVSLDSELARQYGEALSDLRSVLSGSGKPAPGYEQDFYFIAGRPDVLMVGAADVDESDALAQFAEAARAAAESFDGMRKAEGEKLSEDILEKAAVIEGLTAEIEKRAPLVAGDYAERLKNRISELLGEAGIAAAEERIMLEAAIFADKASIAEEITRLKSHIAQLRKIIGESGEPCGKKLDFLAQELNREANTIGSKANDLEITERMLSLKAEIEKIREQVQNVE